MRPSLRAVLALGVTLSVFAAACGDDGGGDDAATTTPPGSSTTLQPQTGGVLSFAEFSEPTSLDPIVTTGNGTTGATEMAAVYDTLLRYDPDTAKYEPRTAESVVASDDSLEWTIKIKPNIKFTDGTDYDAAAVAFGLNRHRSGQGGQGGGIVPACAEIIACPRNTVSTGVYMDIVKEIKIVDKLTLKVFLKEPWAAFNFALSDEAGMIPSPTELKRVCTEPTKPIRDCSYGLKPVGAGPFVVDSFKPGEGITMSRNPTYWDGPVYLDGLKFFSLQDSGADKSFDALKTGAAQVAYLRAPQSVAKAKQEKLPGHSEFLHGGGLFLFNLGVPVQCTGGQPAPICTGKPDGPQPTTPPTAKLKVRQAIAAAIDPKVIDQRANGGTGLPGSELLQKDFRWYPNVPGPKYDPEAAKKLVAEAKAEGWDGKVRLLYSNAQLSVDVSLATEAMLKAVGIETTVDTSRNTTAHVQAVTTQRDFDVSGWGTSIAADDSVSAALAQNLQSTSPSNRVGYKNDIVDAAIKELRAAKTDAAKTAAIAKIVEQVHKDLPMYSWSTIEARITYSDKVQGLVLNHSSVVFFYDAWLKK
ncbi:MAG TPA: ABC transporter substrate-binding protein [Acidimicrobiales bacterium]|jgi:peptide/nickel transport system substrate-binding protein|nr:ABC transporter substrate-binding protein [Acidimicrobiales bacterium]